MNEKIDWNVKDSFGWLRAYFGLPADATSRVIWRAVAKDMARHWFVWITVALGVHLFGHIVFKGVGVALHHFRFYWLAWFFDVEGSGQSEVRQTISSIGTSQSLTQPRIAGGSTPLWTIFFTALAAVAAVTSAFATAIYTRLTQRLVRSQDEPKVVVYVCVDPDRSTVLMIRIANIGHDVATDVAFTSSRPIPAQAYGLSIDTAQPAKEMKSGPLIEGIALLGPGDTRDTTWGQYGGLMKAIGETPIDLNFTYRHGRRTLRGHSRLEVASYTGTDASDNPSTQIAGSLKEIAEAVKTIATESERPQREHDARLYTFRRVLERPDEEAPKPSN